MSFSSILLSSLADAASAAAGTETDSMARAKELLDLVKSPTAVATVVLLAFTTAQLTKNDEGTVDRSRTVWALVAGVLGLLLTIAVVGVMTPLAWRVTVKNAGNHVETRLLVYDLTYLVAIGTGGYALHVVRRALRHLRVS